MHEERCGEVEAEESATQLITSSLESKTLAVSKETWLDIQEVAGIIS
jgi:hypothetical protein